MARLPAQLAPIAGLGLVWSAAPYEGLARDLVAALKFGARLSLAKSAAAAIAAQAPSEFLDGAIVPVPPAPWRHRWRGFDPANAIARPLAAQTGLSLRPCLRRTQGPRQVGRPRAERLEQPPEVSVAAKPPERAILVDDVVTTGATLGACARALRAGGSERVVALTFARTG
jgi:predicted amidophosphoribosyltransferase